MLFAGRPTEICSCGHPPDVHWQGYGPLAWCSAPGCSCRSGELAAKPLPFLLLVECGDPAETVRIVPAKGRKRKAAGPPPFKRAESG